MTTPKRNNITSFLLLAGLLAAVFLRFFLPVETGDIWWHLSVARWITEHKALPLTDPFFPLEGASPWMATQWLGGLFFYRAMLAGGLTGLQLLRCGVVIAGILLFFAHARRRSLPLSWCLALSLLLIYGLQSRVLLRPLLFNILFIQLFLVSLLRLYRREGVSGMWILPALAAVWANIHLGCFVYGQLLIMIFLFASVIEWGKARQDTGAVLRVKVIAVTYILFLAAFLISPYGWKGTVYPFRVFFDPSFPYYVKNYFGIAEMLPPSYAMMSARGWWLIPFFLLGLTALFRCEREKRFLLTILFLAGTAFFIQGQRGIVFFSVVTVYVIAEGFENTLLEKGTVPVWSGRAAALLLSLPLLLGCARKLDAQVYVDGKTQRLLTLKTDPGSPQDAVLFLRMNNIRGLVFNSDRDGGYLLWTAWPRLKPFADGRQSRLDLFRIYNRICFHPEQYFNPAQNFFRFPIVFLDASLPTSHRLMTYLLQRQDWQLVYLKGRHLVFLKRGIFPLPENAARLENRLRDIPGPKQATALLGSIAQSPLRGEVGSRLPVLWAYRQDLEETLTLLSLGLYPAALQKVETILQTDPAVISPQLAREILQLAPSR